MKREYLGWIVAALLVVVVAAGAMQQQAQVGRYQLFQGRYRQATFSDGPGDTARREVAEENAVFRIDTQTGEAHRLVSVNLPDKSVIGWAQITPPGPLPPAPQE